MNEIMLNENRSLHSVSQPSLHSNKSKTDQQSCKSSNHSMRSYSSYRSNHIKGSIKNAESQKSFKYEVFCSILINFYRIDKQKYLTKSKASNKINVKSKPYELKKTKTLIDNREIATARFDYPSLNSK